MNKRNEELIKLAEEALQDPNIYIINDKRTGEVNEAYNGQIAALGVTIAMSGLRPALVIYYQDNKNSKCNKREIVKAIALMVRKPNSTEKYQSAKELMKEVIGKDADLNYYKKEIIDASIALKQVVRTYNLKTL